MHGRSFGGRVVALEWLVRLEWQLGVVVDDKISGSANDPCVPDKEAGEADISLRKLRE